MNSISQHSSPEVAWDQWPRYLALVTSLREWAAAWSRKEDLAPASPTDILLFVLFDDEGSLMNIVGVRGDKYASLGREQSLQFLIERSNWSDHSVEPLWSGLFQLSAAALANAEWCPIPRKGPIVFALYRPYYVFFRRGAGQGWIARDIGIVTLDGAFATPPVYVDLAPASGLYG